MRIVFVRHGEKQKVGEDPSLTLKGIKQAELLAKRLKGWKFDEFYRSDMNRTKETAEPISKKIKMNPKVVEALNEFEHRVIEIGKKGMKDEDTIHQKILESDKGKWTKEEKKHYRNFVSFLKDMSKNPESRKSVLIVAHGIVNRFILANFLKLDLKSTIPFNQSETCINILGWSDEHKNWAHKCWRLEAWNDNEHIPVGLR